MSIYLTKIFAYALFMSINMTYNVSHKWGDGMNRIKNLRTSHSPKMSQEKLGRMIGVARSTVAMWEGGKSEPGNDTLVKLAEIFGVSTDYLLEQDKERKESTVIDDGLSEAERALIKIFRQISLEEQDRVIRIVQAASESLRHSPTLPSEEQ